MKILFLSSGYQGPYVYLERAILSAFQALSIRVCKNQCIKEHSAAKIKQLCMQERPTLIFTLLGYKLPNEVLPWVKAMGMPLVLWQTEDPYRIDQSLQMAPYATAMITIEKNAWIHYEEQGYLSLHLPLGADYTIYKPIEKNHNKSNDICLIGYPYPERVKLIRHIAHSLPVKITVAGNWYPHELPKNVDIASLWLTPEETATYYSNSKIVLNTYRSHTQAENKNSLLMKGISPNNRSFEAAGCQTCQISEAREDWDTWFQPEDIMTFKDEHDIIERVSDLLQQPDIRQSYAENSYQTAITRHSFTNRVQTLLDWLRQKQII